MSRTLPPLSALRAFESAGRHLSFTKAADELNVTPAAISHQIKSLEDLLGVSLFHRFPKGLQLTDAGLSALPSISQGFDKLGHGVARMSDHHESKTLSISVSPSFGAMWLVPRLEQFRSLHPDIEIHIDGTDRLVDLTRDNADVAVRYGPGANKGVREDYLFSALNTPVCSPELVMGKNPLKKPEDLWQHTLLHIDWKNTDASWRMWLLAAGLNDIDASRGPRFTMESMAVQAAIDGQGVALIGDIMVADHLASGRLVKPFDESLNTPLDFAYYLLTPVESDEQERIAQFRKWLLDTAQNEFSGLRNTTA